MSEIVVGVDGSPTGQKALAWALDEARLRSARVLVVHAWQTPAVGVGPATAGLPPAGPVVDVTDLRATVEEGANTVLTAALRDVSAAAEGVDVERQAVEGAAGEALVTAAAGADLLVVGTRGHGALAGLLLGSVSQHCAQHAECPVVIVPPPPE